ncbi:MAG: creatininase family protein [Kiritimatiellae bacterium]|nr:creatininase family protein [Kiritimatiellia bacterium]
MQKRIEAQYMRPDEIIAVREAGGPVFLPIGPLEWHGPHLPLGVDPLRAYQGALALARALGGIVLPTLFAGTERERSPQMLRNIGFEGDEYVVGMDFPQCTLKSLYFKEEVFAVLLRNYLEMLIEDWQFRRIVIVNGHGGENHLAVIHRLLKAFNAVTPARIAFVQPMSHFPNSAIGHATLEETETLMVFYPDSVDLGKLPPRPAPLEHVRFAVVDDAGFMGRNPAHRVSEEEDPRKADPARGQEVWEMTIGELRELLEGAWVEREIVDPNRP